MMQTDLCFDFDSYYYNVIVHEANSHINNCYYCSNSFFMFPPGLLCVYP